MDQNKPLRHRLFNLIAIAGSIGGAVSAITSVFIKVSLRGRSQQ